MRVMYYTPHFLRNCFCSTIFLLLLVSCYTKTEQASEIPDAEMDHSIPSTLPALETKTYYTHTGKTFVITEDEISASLSNISVIGNGFGNFTTPVILGETDPLENAFIADLDADGFDELYLVTRSVGSGSYATLFAIASISDIS